MYANVCSFNLYNLALPGILYYETKKYKKKDYEKKIVWIAKQLCEMEAEIVGFQEVWHKEALVEAVEKSKLFNSKQVYMPPERQDGPVVGLACRYQTEMLEPLEKFPDGMSISLSDGLTVNSFSRPVLRAWVELGCWKVLVYVVHMKSKRPKFFCGEDKNDFSVVARAKLRSLMTRAAECAVLRSQIVTDLSGNTTPLIVLGDLNDGLHSVTTEMAMGAPPWWRFPREKKEKIWDCLLYSTYAIHARRTPRDVYYTHIYNGKSVLSG